MSSSEETVQRGDRLENLEDLYQLSPMQQGMLFHTIYAPESGAYFEQTVFTIEGQLDVVAFKQAWQKVVDRHSILRSSFLWEELERPQQVVHRLITLPIQEDDWSSFSRAEQERGLAEYTQADRDRGFDLEAAPLMRLALFRIATDQYKFVFSRHHLLLDRWSRLLILKEVFALYEAFSQGEELILPEPRPYGDYIAWLAQQDADAAAAFWKDSLKNFTAPTTLPVGSKSSHGSEKASEFGDERMQLSEATSEKLQSFARQQQLTLNTLAQAVWAVLLSRYSSEDDVVFGVTMAGRPANLPQAESMVGLFINTLPLRVGVPARSALLPWLKDLQQKQAELQQYEYCSLLDIQGWSEVPRGVPLFESIFVFENLPVGSIYPSGSSNLQIRSDRGLGSRTGYPLTVLVSPGTRLTIQILFDRSRYDSETVRRMLGHLQTLFEVLPDSAARNTSDLPLLTAAERDEILVQWNATQFTARAGDSIQQLFEVQVEHTPDSTAVMFEGEQLSYRQLNNRANQLAHYLRKLGVEPDMSVGVCMDRSIEMVVGVLAVLKAGGAYVPLDSEYPAGRLRFMIEDAQCSVLLTEETKAAALPDQTAKLISLDKSWEIVAGESPENPGISVDPENLAYVIYTSGSTGQPKGVAMPHRALMNLLAWQLGQENTFRPARTLQFASLSFDVSFQEIFSTWCSGGTLLLVSNEIRRDAAALLRFLAGVGVERIFLPFVYLQHLAEAVEKDNELPISLREIITAGEQLEITPQIAGLCSLLPSCTLHNHYGPSESHVVTAHTLAASPADWPSLPPIGRPILNTQIYLLDRSMQPVPVGIAGELYIGGANVSRGYVNRPDLTAERFIPDPFSRDAGSRLYRTGDLARYQSGGTIEFLGRIDNQVKIRGFRAELGEIEATLARHPAVRQAVVVALEGVPGGRRLVAYLVGDREKTSTLATELRSFLRKSLPDYMVPSDFVLLDNFPLTSSGKIDRRKLPAPDCTTRETDNLYEPPTTSVEEKLVEIWSAVLKRAPIGIRDDFFELGGHSLLAAQLVSRIRSAFNVELPLRRLFEYPRIVDLASVVLNLEQQTQTNVVEEVIPRSIDKNEADALLARIDQLSDAEVDLLLGNVMSEAGGGE